MHLYVSDQAGEELSAEEVWVSSRGVPSRVHELASARPRRAAQHRIAAVAPRAAAGWSELRSGQHELARGVVDQHAARGRGDRLARREAPIVCPFKGLASFDVADAEYFFGRERVVTGT
jgi:hypothetical protein